MMDGDGTVQQKAAVMLRRSTEYLEKYKRWVSDRKNYAKVKQLEDVARMVTLLLPASYAGSGEVNIFSESAFALVNTLGLLNDQIYSDSQKGAQAHLLRKVPAEKTRWALTVVGSLAVVGEMCGARWGGEKGQWKMIAAIELIRGILRLRILMQSQWRTLENGGVTQSMVSPASHAQAAGAPSHGTEWWRGSRGTMLPLPPRLASGSFESVRPPNAPSGDHHIAGELLNIARPIVFVCLRLMFGRKSWLPLLATVATAAASDRMSAHAHGTCEEACRRRGLHGANARIPPAVSQEILRRRLTLLLLFLREPLFSMFTRRAFESVYYGFSYIPLVRSLVRYIIDMVYYLQRHYFYSSGS